MLQLWWWCQYYRSVVSNRDRSASLTVQPCWIWRERWCILADDVNCRCCSFNCLTTATPAVRWRSLLSPPPLDSLSHLFSLDFCGPSSSLHHFLSAPPSPLYSPSHFPGIRTGGCWSGDWPSWRRSWRWGHIQNDCYRGHRHFACFCLVSLAVACAGQQCCGGTLQSCFTHDTLSQPVHRRCGYSVTCVGFIWLFLTLMDVSVCLPNNSLKRVFELISVLSHSDSYYMTFSKKYAYLMSCRELHDKIDLYGKSTSSNYSAGCLAKLLLQK